MTDRPFTAADYPLAETRPDRIRGPRGKPVSDLTLDKLVAGEVAMDDLRITPEALFAQAEIARDAGRPTLGANFERAAEMVGLPQELIMEIYELLRSGRAAGKPPLLAAARRLRENYGAERLAAFVEEAAEVYERRGLFRFRF